MFSAGHFAEFFASFPFFRQFFRTIDSNSSSGLDVEKLLELVKNYTTKNDVSIF